MTNKPLNSRLQLRNDTGENWTTNNPVLLKGETGIVIDSSPIKIKIGDGIKNWTELDYFDIDKTADITTAVNTAVSALGTIFKIKGSVATVDNLPTTDNTNGDVYLVDSAEYVWINDNSWELLGTTATVNLNDYYTKVESDSKYYAKTDTTIVTTADTLILDCGNA